MKRKHLTLCMCVFECYRSCDSSSVGCYQCMCARMRPLTSLKNITNRMHVCITRVEHTAKGCQRGTTLRALRRHCLSHHMAWLVGKKNNNKIIHRCGRLPGRQCFHVIIITNIHCIVMCVCVPRFVCVVVLWVYVEEACWRFACWASPAHQPTTSLCMWRSLHIACCSVERFTWCVRSSSFLFLFLENFVTVDDVFGDMWSRLVYGTRRWLTSPMAWILIDYRNYFIGGSQEGWDGGEWEAWHARHTMSVSFIFVQAIFFLRTACEETRYGNGQERGSLLFSCHGSDWAFQCGVYNVQAAYIHIA